MIIIFMIGRIILGVYWLRIAYNHIFKSAGLVGYTQSKGVKSAKFAVIGTGILALVGGLSIVTGLMPTYGILALTIFLIGVTFKMHAFWKVTDPMQKMGEEINFTKNIAFLGAILMLVAISQPWVWSL